MKFFKNFVSSIKYHHRLQYIYNNSISFLDKILMPNRTYIHLDQHILSEILSQIAKKCDFV